MVELWGNTLSFIGSLFGILIDTILFDAFFPRKRPERYYWPLIVTGTFIIFMFSILVGNRFGYTFAILFEIAVYYLLVSKSLGSSSVCCCDELCHFIFRFLLGRCLVHILSRSDIRRIRLEYSPLFSGIYPSPSCYFFHCTADTKVSSAIICWQTGSRLGAIVCRFPNKHATYHLADLHISP